MIPKKALLLISPSVLMSSMTSMDMHEIADTSPLTNSDLLIAGFPQRLHPYLHKLFLLSAPVLSTNTNMSGEYTDTSKMYCSLEKAC